MEIVDVSSIIKSFKVEHIPEELRDIAENATNELKMKELKNLRQIKDDDNLIK